MPGPSDHLKKIEKIVFFSSSTDRFCQSSVLEYSPEKGGINFNRGGTVSEQVHKEAIFTKAIKTKGRTYFLDVKEASNGNKYLTICESRKVDGEWQRNRIMIFDDNIPAFFQGLKEAAPSLKND